MHDINAQRSCIPGQIELCDNRTSTQCHSPSVVRILVEPQVHDSAKVRLTVLQAATKSLKESLVPGIVIQLFSITLVLLYFFCDPVTRAFDSLADFRDRTGFSFSAISTSLFAGIIPFFVDTAHRVYHRRPLGVLSSASEEALARLTRNENAKCDLNAKTAQKEDEPSTITINTNEFASPLRGSKQMWASLAFFTLFWAFRGVDVDFFYQCQAKMFGSGHSADILAEKVAFDLLVYTPIWSSQLVTTVYLWRECGFSFRLFMERFDFYELETFKVPSMLIPSIAIWTPCLVVIYAFPTALQLPLCNLVSCFFSIFFIVIAQL